MTHLEKHISFNFMGVGLKFKTNSDELLDRLSKDFSFFINSEKDLEEIFEVNSILEDVISVQIPDCPLVRRSKNSLTYDQGRVRYNDYHGKLISIYDYENEKGDLFSNSLEKLHEITYLLILSRIGKYFDLLGVHKIHAMGFVYRGICCVGMMNMGVGKSTLLMELLRDPEIELLSDDTPLIDGEGRVHAFPLRIGVEKIPENYPITDSKVNKYSLQREEYGLKELICLNGISNRIADSYSSLVVFEGHRGNGAIRRGSKLSLWLALQRHMVVGVGLPIIFEYFWENGFSDFLRKTKIFLLRQRAAFKLVLKCEYYKFFLGKSSEDNARALKNILSEKSSADS